MVAPASPRPRPATISPIEFDHVWFAYKDEDWVLRDVSFPIEPGETIAVVGHTGAGKTTLISLLLRFYDVQQGSIRIGGVDIREFDPLELRRKFGVVLQDPYLFTGTIDDNIRLGTEGIHDDEVEAAAEQVNLMDFIRTLPDGFSQPIRERGSGLSTGQKQLISFARALAHNPRFLILDEATSSVDTETEFRVRDALARMVEGRTSHRDRAPPLHHPARRPHSGDAQRPTARERHRTRNCSRCAAFTGSCTSCSTRIRSGWRSVAGGPVASTVPAVCGGQRSHGTTLSAYRGPHGAGLRAGHNGNSLSSTPRSLSDEPMRFRLPHVRRTGRTRRRTGERWRSAV